jgi:hypothetical protein
MIPPLVGETPFASEAPFQGRLGLGKHLKDTRSSCVVSYLSAAAAGVGLALRVKDWSIPSRNAKKTSTA